jgi:hypothetical protein
MKHIPITHDPLIETMEKYEATYRLNQEIGMTEYKRLGIERDLGKTYFIVNRAYEGKGTKIFMSSCNV